MKVFRILFLVLFLLPVCAFAQDSELYKFLKAIPGAEVVKKDTSAFKEFYILMLPQAVDHKDPNGKFFLQRIFVGHSNFGKPTVMETEGYDAGRVSPFTLSEPTKLLGANQVYVEHRFFGASIPSPVDWKYLTAEQDAGDYHYIRTLFGLIYTGKWIATGVSKGGQTATEYKVFYPDDMDVTRDPSYQEKLKNFIESNAQHMIFIYGEADPWGATAAEIKPGSESLKMVQTGGTHSAQIVTLTTEQRKLVITTLEI